MKITKHMLDVLIDRINTKDMYYQLQAFLAGMEAVKQ